MIVNQVRGSRLPTEPPWAEIRPMIAEHLPGVVSLIDETAARQVAQQSAMEALRAGLRTETGREVTVLTLPRIEGWAVGAQDLRTLAARLEAQ